MRRVTAVLTGALAALVGLELATSQPGAGYDLAIGCAAVLGTAVAAVRLWSTESFSARVSGALLTGLIVVGQVLFSAVGLPGAAAAHWQPAGIAVMLAALAVLLMSGAGMPSCHGSDQENHPYAL